LFSYQIRYSFSWLLFFYPFPGFFFFQFSFSTFYFIFFFKLSLILLIALFFILSLFISFQSVPQNFISFVFLSNFSPYSFKKIYHFLNLFFLSILSLKLYYIFLSNFGPHSFNCSFFFRLSHSLFSLIIFIPDFIRIFLLLFVFFLIFYGWEFCLRYWMLSRKRRVWLFLQFNMFFKIFFI